MKVALLLCVFALSNALPLQDSLHGLQELEHKLEDLLEHTFGDRFHIVKRQQDEDGVSIHVDFKRDLDEDKFSFSIGFKRSIWQDLEQTFVDAVKNELPGLLLHALATRDTDEDKFSFSIGFKRSIWQDLEQTFVDAVKNELPGLLLHTLATRDTDEDVSFHIEFKKRDLGETLVALEHSLVDVVKNGLTGILQQTLIGKRDADEDLKISIGFRDVDEDGVSFSISFKKRDTDEDGFSISVGFKRSVVDTLIDVFKQEATELVPQLLGALMAKRDADEDGIGLTISFRSKFGDFFHKLGEEVVDLGKQALPIVEQVAIQSLEGALIGK